MSDEEALMFIDSVKLHAAIWDKKSVDYKHIQKKANAWNTIAASGYCSLEELKSKRKSLHGAFRKLRSVYTKSMITDSGKLIFSTLLKCSF